MDFQLDLEMEMDFDLDEIDFVYEELPMELAFDKVEPDHYKDEKLKVPTELEYVEVGKELEPSKADNSKQPLDEANIDKDFDEYLYEQSSTDTRKSTAQAVKLFNKVMSSFHVKSGTVFKELAQLSLEELPVQLS